MNRGRYFVFVLFNILWVPFTRGEYPNMVTIKSFSPKIAAVGQTIHFKGTNLNKVAKVQLNGVTVPPVNIVRKLASSTEFDLMVPPEATTGIFRLITLDGK